ncbi:AMP-binding protein, partial [Bacillus atrophaeus]|uniref:AMP-binding protein n=1 Tax=Bacillus atrophaeus TaxID=1452 RepID=UPI002E1B25D9|nr:AMP-binding protein [Bacillus atrophaeus]
MLSWDYVSELFEENIIESMFNDYVAIIENLLANNQFSYPSHSNLERVVSEYNDTSTVIQPDTLYRLFERQALETPENVAIEFKDRGITYQELRVMSNRIARYLEMNGVQTNDFVGVIVNREIETIANILAILKTGAAYIPINPDFPKERQTYILQDGECKISLTPELAKSIIS